MPCGSNHNKFVVELRGMHRHNCLCTGGIPGNTPWWVFHRLQRNVLQLQSYRRSWPWLGSQRERNHASTQCFFGMLIQQTYSIGTGQSCLPTTCLFACHHSTSLAAAQDNMPGTTHHGMHVTLSMQQHTVCQQLPPA